MTLVLVGVHAATTIFPFYYSYWEIEGMMQSQADVAQVKTDSEIFAFLADQIRRQNLPIRDIESELRIDRAADYISLELGWEEVYELPIYGREPILIHVFEFNAYAEADLQ